MIGQWQQSFEGKHEDWTNRRWSRASFFPLVPISSTTRGAAVGKSDSTRNPPVWLEALACESLLALLLQPASRWPGPRAFLAGGFVCFDCLPGQDQSTNGATQLFLLACPCPVSILASRASEVGPQNCAGLGIEGTGQTRCKLRRNDAPGSFGLFQNPFVFPFDFCV